MTINLPTPLQVEESGGQDMILTCREFQLPSGKSLRELDVRSGYVLRLVLI